MNIKMSLTLVSTTLIIALMTGCATSRNVATPPNSGNSASIPTESERMTNIPAPVQIVIDSINNGDKEAFVAAFTPDGIVNDWGRILRGSAGIASWADTDAIGQNAKIEITSAKTNGSITDIRFNWSSKRFNGPSRAYVTVTGDKVSEFRIPNE
ncbi:hypothetical protein [Gordonia sp. CPCC 205333]|uniref:hypothetical protein n=1 Tax=Gordonia sp. CPCC 205333 TaxID=3140790 RepID=UPI003AF3921F